jgi:hypothetical protein
MATVFHGSRIGRWRHIWFWGLLLLTVTVSSVRRMGVLFWTYWMGKSGLLGIRAVSVTFAVIPSVTVDTY